MKLIYFLLLFLLLNNTAYSQNNPRLKKINKDKDKNGKYVNPFLGLTIKYNPSWHTRSKKERKKMMSRGISILKTSKREKEAYQQVIDNNVSTLLVIHKSDPEIPVKSNPSFSFIVEDISLHPNIETATDYLDASKALFAQVDLPYTFDDEYQTVKVGGKEFVGMNLELRVTEEIVVHQMYMTAIIEGFAVNFVLTYLNEPDKLELFKILKNTSFKD